MATQQTVYFKGENHENVSKLAKEQRRPFNDMVNVIIQDSFDGTTIPKQSIKDFVQANPKASAQQLLTYFKLACVVLVLFASSCTREIYQAKFTGTNAKFLYPSKSGKAYKYQIGDTIEVDSYRNGKRTAVIIGRELKK